MLHSERYERSVLVLVVYFTDKQQAHKGMMYHCSYRSGNQPSRGVGIVHVFDVY